MSAKYIFTAGVSSHISTFGDHDWKSVETPGVGKSVHLRPVEDLSYSAIGLRYSFLRYG